MRLYDLPERQAGHIASAHDMDLHTAIQLGVKMGAQLPEVIDIVGIEAQRVYDIMEELTPAIYAAVPHAVQCVCEIIQAIDF